MSLSIVFHSARVVLRCARPKQFILNSSRNHPMNFNHVVSYSTRNSNIPKKILNMSVVGAVTVLGIGYIGYDLNPVGKEIAPEVSENETVVLKELPNIKPTRRVNNSGEASDLHLTLFQYQTCPFCCKVRAFLDANGISYDVVEVDAVLRQSIKWSSYKKVPILLIKTDAGYQQLNDSSAIISIISSYLLDKSQSISDIINFYPSVKYNDEKGKSNEEILNKYFLMFNQVKRERSLDEINNERKWRRWADDVLVHTLSPNVYRSKEEALQAFQWFCEVGQWREHFPAWECSLMVYVGAYAMYFIGKRLKKKHNLKDDVRQSLYDECNNWVKQVNKRGGAFMGGTSPNLADLSVYGVLCSIEGCDAFQDLALNTKIMSWYSNMKDHVSNRKGVTLL